MVSSMENSLSGSSQTRLDRQSTVASLEESNIKPNISGPAITVALSKHGTRDDARSLRPYIAECDIYIPEQSSWDQTRLSVWQQVSDGELTPDQAFQLEEKRGRSFNDLGCGEFVHEILGCIYNTGKKIVLADLELGDPIKDDLLTIYQSFSRSMIDWESSFAANKAKIRNFFEQEFALHDQREGVIVSNIASFLRHSDKLSAENQKICVTIGSDHLNFAAKLRMQALGDIQPVLLISEEQGSSRFAEVQPLLSYSHVQDMLTRARWNGTSQDLEDLLVPYFTFDFLRVMESRRPDLQQVFQEELGLESSDWREIVRAYNSGRLTESALISNYDLVQSAEAERRAKASTPSKE